MPSKNRTHRTDSDFNYYYESEENYSTERLPPPPPVPPPGRFRSRGYRNYERYDYNYDDRHYNSNNMPISSRGRSHGMAPPPAPIRPPPGQRARSRPRPKPRAREPRYSSAPYYDDEYDYAYPPPKRETRTSRPRREQYYDDEPGSKRSDSRGNRSGSRGDSGVRRPNQTETSSGSRKMFFIIGFVFLLLVLYIFRGPIMEALENSESPSFRYQEYPEGLDFTIRKSMTLTVNPTRQNSYISYKLKSACPKDKFFKIDQDNFYLQDIKNPFNVQPEPSNGVPNINDQEQWVMLWEESRFTGTKTFVIEYTITTRFFQWEFTEENSGSIKDISNNLKQNYNHDEWKIDNDHDGVLDDDDDIDNDGEWDYMIEPTNPAISKLAKDIVGVEDNVYLAVKKLYDYLTNDENLNYITAQQGLPKACTVTLSELRGDCDDYSILFVSLCRALDIPAWLELGVLYDRESRTWGGHAWSKVAIPLPGGGYSAPVIDIVNKQFMIFDPYRFIEWVDTGGDDIYPGEDGVRNNLDYYYHTFSFIATGRPDVVAPDTNKFTTIKLEEFGEKQRVPVEGDPGLETCMIPGFEISFAIPATLFIILFFKFNMDPLTNRKIRFN